MAQRSRTPRFMEGAPAVRPLAPLATERVGDTANMIVDSVGSTFGVAEETGGAVDPYQLAPVAWQVECPNCGRRWDVQAFQLGTVIPCLCAYEIMVVNPNRDPEQVAAEREAEDEARFADSDLEMSRRLDARQPLMEARRAAMDVEADRRAADEDARRQAEAAADEDARRQAEETRRLESARRKEADTASAEAKPATGGKADNPATK